MLRPVPRVSGRSVWFLLLATVALSSSDVGAAEPLRALDLRQVTVGGWIGERMEATIHNNLCRLKIDDDFLRPFREKKSRNGAYIGLGKLIDALVRLAANSNDAQLLALKKAVVAKTIAIQEPDGYLAHCSAQLQLGRLEPFRFSGCEPDPKLLVSTRRAIEFLTRGDGLVISGACGMHECWHDTQEATFNLGETCATAYLLRLLDDLMRQNGDSRWGDLMERSIYNALFAAQSPDGRRIRYYVPLEGKRAYWRGDTYCCPGNYHRIVDDEFTDRRFSPFGIP